MKNILKKPNISEKSFKDTSIGKYTFIVNKDASKEIVAKECESLFNVTVTAVNMIRYKGKVKMVKRIKGKRNDFKKAIVSLKKGDKIDLFEVESEKPAEVEKPVKATKTSTAKTATPKETKDVEVTIKEKTTKK